MTDRTCGNCRWWNRHSGLASGDCQRHPPVYNGEWAVTDEVDFCGQWADKTITPEQEAKRELVRRFAVAIVSGDDEATGARYKPSTVWMMAEQLADTEPRNSGREI